MASRKRAGSLSPHAVITAPRTEAATKGLKGPWPKGQSGNPSGKPKGTAEFATAMREAFTEADTVQKRSLVDVVLAIAFNDANPKQMEAIKFCAAYGWGLPKRALDDETVKKLAEEMMIQALEEARKRRAAEAAQLPVNVTT